MKNSILKRLMIFSPTAPPGVCGVSDYSWHIAQALAKYYYSVRIGVSKMPADQEKHVAIPVTSWQQALTTSGLSQYPHDLIINYTPSSYSRLIWPVGFQNAIAHFKQAKRGNKVFVIFHEIWNGSKGLKMHHAIYAKIAKQGIQKLSAIADGVIVVTKEQQQQLEQLPYAGVIRLGNIGSNILPPNPLSGLNSVRSSSKWVVFGLAHTRLWTLEAHADLIKALIEQGTLKKLYTIGPVDNKFGKQEREFAAQHFGPGILKQLGILSSGEISEHLLSAGVAFVAQSTDSLNKSGSFAALAAHALPVVCAIADPLPEPLNNAIFRKDEILKDASLIFGPEGIRRTANLHEWFWLNKSWDAIGLDLKNWMNDTYQEAELATSEAL